MVSLSRKKVPLWSILLILVAGIGSLVYVFVGTIVHNSHPVAPDFTLTASRPSQGIVQGLSGTTQVTVTSIGGFAGTVSLTATALPGGANNVSPAISPATITLTANRIATMSLNVSAVNASLATYNVTVVGRSGTVSHQVSVTVIVLPPNKCTPGYTCPSTADPLSIRVSQNTNTLQVSAIAIYNHASYTVGIDGYYYTYGDQSQLGTEYVYSAVLTAGALMSFSPTQPGVQVYGLTVLWQAPPPPPSYTLNSQLNQSWVPMSQSSYELLFLDAYSFTSGTNVTLYLRNTGTTSSTLVSYYVTDPAGDQYFLNNWKGPTISVNSVAPAVVMIGASCPSCTLTGNPFTFTTGVTYTVIVVTTYNNQFPYSIKR